MGQSVSNVVARSILGFLQTQGVAVQSMMAQCGISRYELDKVDGRLSAAQHFRFIQACSIYQSQWMRSVLEMHVEQGLTALNYAAYPELMGICLNQPDGRSLLQTYQQYRTVIGDCDRIHITKNDTHTRIEYIHDGPRENNFSAAGNFMLIFDVLRQSIPDLRGQIWLESPRDARDSRIDAFFRQSCTFEQTSNVLQLENAQLDQPSPCFNQPLFQGQLVALQQRCAQIGQPLSFSGLVSELIEQTLGRAPEEGERHILPQVCALLGMSRWTLNERLRPAQTSFSELLKNVRIRLACRWLAESDKSIQQISDLVCFSSQAVFSRFFSTHLGMTPLGYRQRYGRRAWC